VIYISITIERLFKAAAISSAKTGKAPMPAAVVIAVVIKVAEFAVAFSRDAATHFLGLVFLEGAGHSS
jgi:hypothetical protein